MTSTCQLISIAGKAAAASATDSLDVKCQQTSCLLSLTDFSATVHREACKEDSAGMQLAAAEGITQMVSFDQVQSFTSGACCLGL